MPSWRRRTPLGNDEGERDTLGLGFLASALAGRALEVTAGDPGEPAWTDGRVVFVDPVASRRDQIETLAVQASLLAAGSLEPDVVRRFARRPALARRYLALEGHRALAASEDLLPLPVRSLIDCNIAGRGDSPAASLAAALSREPIADPPGNFGAIRARRLLASNNRADTAATTRERVARQQAHRVLVELEEDENDDVSGTVDLFSSPVGGGGALGQLLQRMLGVVRQLDGGGPPGSDAPTHGTRPRTLGAGNAAFSTAMAGTAEEAAIEDRGTKYPEWDVHRRSYRRDWCTVQEVEPRPSDSAPSLVWDGYGLRRPLARLGMGLDRCHRRVQGDEIDIDAVVEARVEAMAGSAPDEAIYVESLHRRRDLAVLLLLDTSGSAAEPAARAKRFTNNSGPRPPRSLSPFTTSAIAWRSTPTTRGAGRRDPGAGEALRRPSRYPRDAASSRPRARRLFEAGCGDPTRRGRVGKTGRDVAAAARRAVRRLGVRPRL